jgi:hypothetical protein
MKRKGEGIEENSTKKICCENDLETQIVSRCDEDVFDAHFFEESSKAWRSNKIEQDNCTYVYKCTFVDMKGKRCNRPLYEYELRNKKKELKENAHLFCKCHINKKYLPHKYLWI